MASSGKVTGSQLIGRALKLEGVQNVFALAGDHTLPVMDTMFDMDFRFVDVRHEQAAVHMADAASPDSPESLSSPLPAWPTRSLVLPTPCMEAAPL